MSSSSGLSSAPDSPPAPGYGRGVWIHRYEQDRTVSPAIVSFALRLVAFGGHLMPNEIFRFQEHPFDPAKGTYRLEYDGVCSAADLEEWPIGEADRTRFPRYCRLAEVTLLCRSEAEADAALSETLLEANHLVTAMDIADRLVDAGVVAVGNPPPASESSSSSAA